MVRVVLFRFDGLVEAIAPAAARHQASGELVDDHDRAVLHHVFDVEVEQRVRAERLVDVVEDAHVDGVVESVAVGQKMVRHHLLGLRHAALGERHRLVFFVDDVIARQLEGLPLFGLGVALDGRAGREPGHDAIDLVIEVRRFLRGARDDERRPRFVDQDAVDLVHDCEVMPALHVVREVELHVVAEVIEPELVVGAVGDIAAVGDLPFGVVEVVLDDPDCHPQEAVDAAHPLRVAAGKIVVDGDDVNPFACERVQIGRQGRDERLAFAGLHLGDPPFVQHHAADELYVEVAHVEHTASRFTYDGERLREEIVQRRALLDPFTELRGLAAQLVVRQRLDGGLERIDGPHTGPEALDFALVLCAENGGERFLEHEAGLPDEYPRHCTTRENVYRASSVIGLVSFPFIQIS
jgi:hypothetical protein